MKLYYTKHTAWYWERFYINTALFPTYKEAWEQTEKEHFERFEFYKYESYSSFRSNKNKLKR